MEHTEGKWKVEKQGEDIIVVAGDNPVVAQMVWTYEYLEKERNLLKKQANAHRIVACVNACKGVKTETLKAYAGDIEFTLDTLQSRLDQSEKALKASERTKRKALNKVKELLKDASPITHTEIQAARIIEILEGES